jgi:hypothetical protein
MSDRDEPLKQPCKDCGGELYRTLETAGMLSDSKSTMRRAGSEWQDRLKQIKKGSGRNNNIKV